MGVSIFKDIELNGMIYSMSLQHTRDIIGYLNNSKDEIY